MTQEIVYNMVNGKQFSVTVRYRKDMTKVERDTLKAAVIKNELEFQCEQRFGPGRLEPQGMAYKWIKTQ